MSFFDVPHRPDDEDVEPFDEGPFDQPGRWLGGVVAVEQLVGRSDEGAVGVRRITAYEDGFELEVMAWVRRPPRRRRRGRFGREILLASHGPVDIRDDDGKLVPELVRLGVQFADGGKATNIDDLWSLSPDATDPALGMSSTSGSSSGNTAEQTFWIWPVPETGDVVLVCEWPAQGIAESRLVIDGDVLRSAASRSAPVWPDEPARSHIPLEQRVRTLRSRGTRTTSIESGDQAAPSGPERDTSGQRSSIHPSGNADP